MGSNIRRLVEFCVCERTGDGFVLGKPNGMLICGCVGGALMSKSLS